MINTDWPFLTGGQIKGDWPILTAEASEDSDENKWIILF